MVAILYTLVETAKVCGVGPIAYLVEAATRNGCAGTQTTQSVPL